MITIKADGKTKRRKTSDFKYAKFDFPAFYPVQSAILDRIEDDVNIVVDSPMGSGKTLVAEMAALISLKEGRNVVYASPYKQITYQKDEQWGKESHPFADLRRAVLTGDFTGNPSIETKVRDAQIVSLTYEMLDSRARKDGEKSAFLEDVGLCIVDECHNVALEGRGDRLETGLMAFTEKNPDARLVLLSGTIRNSDVLAKWMQKLNGKKTIRLKSTWRSTKLIRHFETYEDQGRWWPNRDLILNRALDIVAANREDQTIVFVHAKSDGWEFMKRMREELPDLSVDFHNADVDLPDRTSIADRFMKGGLRVLVATNTVGEGVEYPAYRTIVCGTKRGGHYDVWPILIDQELNRAGRPSFGTEGHAHLILCEDELSDWRRILKELPEIDSQLAGAATLRFHVASLVDTGRATTPRELVGWHRRSLRCVQGFPLTLEMAKGMFERFEEKGILTKIGGSYQTTLIGKVAARLYFDPLAISAWVRNWKAIAEQNLLYDDYAVAWAVGYSDQFAQGFGRKAQEAIKLVKDGLRERGLTSDPYEGPIAAVYWGMEGKKVAGLSPLFRQIRADSRRYKSAWTMLLPLFGDHPDVDEGYFDKVGSKLGSPMTWTQAEFCRVPEIGPVRSKRLVEYGVESWKDFLASQVDGGKRELAMDALRTRPGNMDEEPKRWRRAAKAITDMMRAGKIDLKKKTDFLPQVAPLLKAEDEDAPSTIELPLWAMTNPSAKTARKMKD